MGISGDLIRQPQFAHPRLHAGITVHRDNRPGGAGLADGARQRGADQPHADNRDPFERQAGFTAFAGLQLSSPSSSQLSIAFAHAKGLRILAEEGGEGGDDGAVGLFAADGQAQAAAGTIGIHAAQDDAVWVRKASASAAVLPASSGKCTSRKLPPTG